VEKDVALITCPVCGTKNRVPRDRMKEGPKCGRCRSALPGLGPVTDHPLQVTDQTFQTEVLSSPLPVILDCWAPWCGPCKMVSPILDELAHTWAYRIRVAKLNVDENPATASRYSVQSIPTLILFRGGKEVDRMVGALPRGEMERWLNARL